MTDVALKNPIVTAVQAVKSGNDIAAVSSSNPLPTNLPAGWAINNEAINGRLWIARFLKTGAATKYSAIQIKNTGSLPIVVASVAVGGVSGSNFYRVVRSTSDLANASSFNYMNYKTDITAAPSSFSIRDTVLDSLTAIGNNCFTFTGTAISTVQPASAAITTLYILVPPSERIQIECDTAGMGFYLNAQIVELPA